MKKTWLKGTSKLVAVLMVMALLVTFVACGGAATPTPAPAAATPAPAAATPAPAAEAAKPVALAMVTWVQETNQKALDALNAAFTQKYPNVTITVDTAPANDYPTLLMTRLAAGTVDIVSQLAANDNLPQEWTRGCDKPAWQTYIEGGNFLDLTDQPFIKNWDPGMIKNAVSYQGKVYGIDVGAVAYNGLFYNKKMFADNGLAEPGTWADLQNIAKVLQGKGIAPITLGLKDTWPLSSIAVSGIVGANETDLAAFAKGLWTGERKFTDEKTMKMYNRMAEFVSWIEKNAAAVGAGDVPGRFVGGKAAMAYTGTWDSGSFTALDANFQFGYFAVPGDVDAKPNQLQGKYDMQVNIYAKTANKDTCLQWFDFLSQKENYTPFVSALGFFPTMPGVTSTSAFVASIADKNKNFSNSWEKVIVPPKGVGQYASGQGFPLNLLKAVGGTVKDVNELSQLAQKDWDTALAAAKYSTVYSY